MVEFRLVAFIFPIGGFGLAVFGGSMAGHRSSIERQCSEPQRHRSFASYRLSREKSVTLPLVPIRKEEEGEVITFPRYLLGHTFYYGC